MVFQRRRTPAALAVAGALVLGLALAGPVAAVGPTVTVVASGLDNPRGISSGPDGSLYVAEIVKSGVLNLFLGTDDVGALWRLKNGTKIEDAARRAHRAGRRRGRPRREDLRHEQEHPGRHRGGPPHPALTRSPEARGGRPVRPPLAGLLRWRPRGLSSRP